MAADKKVAKTKGAPKSNQRVLTVSLLAMINVAAILTLRTMPQMATYGLGSIFFYTVAIIIFFIPVALVSAELATGWPQTGGVYVWVKEAFGERWGFLAIWLQWIENIIYFPTILSFAAAVLIFPLIPQYSQNKWYVMAMVLIIFWGSTFANFRGMRLSGLISSIGIIIGTLIPGAVLIILGIAWLLTGDNSATILQTGPLIPDMSNIANIVFAGGVILGLAGMEMSAVHAQEVKNPQRDYPKAIFLSTLIILSFSIIGSLVISFVTPRNISLTTGVIVAIKKIFESFGIGFLVPVFGVLMAIGAVATVSTWVVGPSRGLFATAANGELPPFIQKVNKNRMPVNMLITQAVITSILAAAFLFMPSVNSAYFILSALTSQLYLIMYFLMFLAAIRLRYSKADVKRAYRVPGGKIGMWIVSGIGAIGAIAVIFTLFVPPSQIQTGSETFYLGFLGVGIVLMVIAPFVVHHFRRPSWAKYAKDHPVLDEAA